MQLTIIPIKTEKKKKEFLVYTSNCVYTTEKDIYFYLTEKINLKVNVLISKNKITNINLF